MVRKLTKKEKVITGVLLFLLAFIATIWIGVSLIVDNVINKIVPEDEPVDVGQLNIAETPEQAHDVVNILLVGADNSDWGHRETSWSEARADIQKIITLDKTDKKIKITSLERDIVVYFPGEKYRDFYRFNWAYEYGKSNLCMATINYNLDLNIQKYVSMSFAGFIHVIDQIGGVDIRLFENEAAALNKGLARHRLTDGYNHLDGYDALMYARLRHIDSDIERMDRQNTVIKKVIDKLSKQSYQDLLKIVEETLPYVNTNLDSDEIKGYLLNILTFDLKKLYTYTFPENGITDTYWNGTTSMGGNICSDYSKEVTSLHEFIYGVEDYEPSENVRWMNEEIHRRFPRPEQ